MTKQVQELDHVIIRFAGDSGDGMQLTGDRFTQETAVFGNDLSTLPNFPAEIRAPAGTLPGVSSFQLHFADHDILTPGDAPDVLVAMNPAALKANLKDLPLGAELIVNTDEFTKRNLAKVGYEKNPLEDGSLDGYQLHPVPLTSLTVKALEDQDISRKDAERAKNMFALGLLSWLYGRPAEGTLSFLEAKFGKKPEIYKANVTAFQAGWNYGETTEDFAVRYEVKPATIAPGPLPQHHRQPRARLRPDRRGPARQAAAVPRLVPDHPGLGHPARAVQAQEVRRPHLPGRGRDQRGQRGARRLVRRLARGDHHVRPGHAAEGGDRQPRRLRGAPAARRRRAARRPLHRHADQDRADRPADGAVRQERRVAGAGRSRRPRRRTASSRRSRPPGSRSPTGRRSSCCPTGTWAMARSRGGSPTLRNCRTCRPGSPSPLRRTSPPTGRTSSRSPATRRPSPARGRSRARPASSTASAASRRPTARGTSPTTRTTTT